MGLIVQKEGFNMVVKVCPSMSRSGVKHQYMIGWGAGSVYMKDLVNALHIFQETRRNLKRWQTREFLMKKYFIGTLIYVV
jgi:hypothetical protein